MKKIKPLDPMPCQLANHALAKELAEKGGFVERGKCWQNSIMTMLLAPTTSEMRYIEGWLLLAPDFATEHGWLEIEGQVVDVTLTDKQQATDYFPIFRYTFAETRDLILGWHYMGRLPFFDRHKHMKQAMRDTFEMLPINSSLGRFYAYRGWQETGIASVILPEGTYRNGR